MLFSIGRCKSNTTWRKCKKLNEKWRWILRMKTIRKSLYKDMPSLTLFTSYRELYIGIILLKNGSSWTNLINLFTNRISNRISNEQFSEKWRIVIKTSPILCSSVMQDYFERLLWSYTDTACLDETRCNLKTKLNRSYLYSVI